MPKINKKKAINELNEFKSLCLKTIEEIESNKKQSILFSSEKEAEAIELKTINQSQQKDELKDELKKLEDLLSEVAPLNQAFYEKMLSCVESNNGTQIEGLEETTAKLVEKFDSLQKSALKLGLLKEESLFHKMINALFKIIFVKENIFNSIVNLDFLKSPKDFKTSFDEKIKQDQAMYYIGPDHEKYSKNLKCVSMLFAGKKMEPEEQSVDKDKNPTPTAKTC